MSHMRKKEAILEEITPISTETTTIGKTSLAEKIIIEVLLDLRSLMFATLQEVRKGPKLP